MTPADIRNDTHATKRDGHAHNRGLVLDAMRRHGACDTRTLAHQMGWDVLAVRPRVTELLQAGLVVLDGRGTEGGIYRVASPAEAQAAQHRRLGRHAAVQDEMPFMSGVRRRSY